MKEDFPIFMSERLLFLFTALFSLFFSMFLWIFIFDVTFESSIIFYLFVSGLPIYCILGIGWSQGNTYSYLATLRAAAQFLAYELILTFSYIIIMLCTGTTCFADIFQHRYLIFELLPVALIMFIAILGENFKLPFDMAEAESELVAGIHIDLMSLIFVAFFLSENIVLLINSFLYVFLFFGCSNILLSNVLILLFLFLVFFIRGSLPRIRIDFLITFFWKILLPIVFSLFCIYVSIFLISVSW